MPKPERRSSQLKKILSIASDHLAATLAHAADLQRLQPLVFKALPADLAAHCRPGNLRGNTLVIHADSPAWAAKMRFHAPQLIRSLRRANGLSALERCEVRVLPVTTAPSGSTPTASAISVKSREQLRSAAMGLKDPRLKAAFDRLADGENELK